MNDKIKELAQEATEWCQENAHGTPVAWEWEDKFAELIVRDCIEIVEASKVGFSQVPAEVALDLTAKNIKAYFGLK